MSPHQQLPTITQRNGIVCNTDVSQSPNPPPPHDKNLGRDERPAKATNLKRNKMYTNITKSARKCLAIYYPHIHKYEEIWRKRLKIFSDHKVQHSVKHT